MKLLELYSLATGLRIGQQYLVETFYPLPFDRYITVQGGSGMAAKNYPHYSEVLALLATHLTAAGISVVQLGGKDDPALPGCYHLQGQTNLHQSNYLLGRALCHIGNDSWLSHRGGKMAIPLVITFGPTSVANHSPYRCDCAKSVFIESHRFGRRPSFASQESPSTIALIPPEQIANAALSLLGLMPPVTRQSLFIGDAYHQRIIELVPNVVIAPQVQIPGALVVRMDHSDGIPDAVDKLLGNLQVRPCSIVTDREINLNLLAQAKPRIAGLRIEVGKVSIDWIKAVKRLGLPAGFFSSERDPDKLARLRLDLYDACLFDHFVPPTREDFLKGANVYMNRELDSGLRLDTLGFRTNRLTLSDGKVYLSLAHWKAGQHVPTSEQNWGTVIDDPLFWGESLAHLYVHSQ